MIVAAQQIFVALDKFPLAAIPFFILAGNLMDVGGISRRLVEFAKSMVGETLKVTETQDWGPAGADGSRRGTVAMAVAGAPIALTGTLAIAPGGAGTVEQLDAELKARVPLIGGKIEKAAAPPIEEAIEIEATTAQEWLAR